MGETIEELEGQRRELYRRLGALPDFRPGTISANLRRCGRDNCACAKANHPGHGPQYLWSSKIDGRSVAENLSLGPHLEKVRQEVETYRTFTGLAQQIVAVNRDICKQRPVQEIKNPDELSSLKKKLQRIFARKFKQKHNV